MESSLIWGSPKLKRVTYTLIGRPLFYMTFIFSTLGALLFLAGLGWLLGNTFGII